MANEKIGTLVTESLGGYTWAKNSRLNRITAWSNDRIKDIPSEIIYFKDMDTNKKWTMGFNPMHDNNDYYITYGWGYAKYLHESDGIKQELTIFVPKEDGVKVNLLCLKNNKLNSRNIKLIYYIKPVLGEDEIKTNTDLHLKYNKEANIMILNNTSEENEKIYISSSEKINSYTGNKGSFLFKSDITNPDGLDQIELNRDNSYGKEGVIAIEWNIKIDSMEEKEIAIIIGKDNDDSNTIEDIAYKYSNIENCKEELNNVKKYWHNLLTQISVKTPSESMNILLNGWLEYQTITSRMISRTGFYQSGGAYGFRDQLQDSLAVKYLDSNIQRKQILKHCKHQFIEGDVEHWWHDEISRGIRTKFSDDLLWLPYAVSDYIEFTNDESILDEIVEYREGEVLKEDEVEKYDYHPASEKKGNVYEHCIKAIEKTLSFGENNLPLIGSGDWNDGFSNVGIKKKGESVWLGFFMYDVLKHFIPLCIRKNEEERAKKYENIMENLKRALNTNAWDGRWFKRAFTDNGEVLGSLQNEECKIDSISQSWSVISGAGDNDKKYISMESLESHLIDKINYIIKLLDPPFDRSNLNPGYIKSYIPGTRENGGQYTHAAAWVVIAEAILNLNEKAFEHYKMINPIEHSKTKELSNNYKVEPYVIAADVYGSGNLIGRGGWTWYTGSSSWMYIAGIKYILGIRISGNYLTIEPHVPQTWNEYSVKLCVGKSIYNIIVKKCYSDEKYIVINRQRVTDTTILLNDDGNTYNVEAFIL